MDCSEFPMTNGMEFQVFLFRANRPAVKNNYLYAEKFNTSQHDRNFLSYLYACSQCRSG